MENNDLDNSLLNSYKAFTGSHFLFNVINTIQSDLLLNRPKEAFQTLQIFNRLYKYAVRCSNEQFTPLDEEIGFLNQYVSMEQIRFGNSKLPKSISCGDCPKDLLIPTFVFQNFIENGILLSLELPKPSGLNLSFTQKQKGINLCIKLPTSIETRYHGKTELKTKYAEKRLALLAETGLIDFELTWHKNEFMNLLINHLEH